METTSANTLTTSEKKVLFALGAEKSEVNSRRISEKTNLKEDAVMQAAFMLAQKKLVEIIEAKKFSYHLTEEGEAYAEEGLPERRALDFLLKKEKGAVRVSLEEIESIFTRKDEAAIALGWLRKKDWARIENGIVVPKETPETLREGKDEKFLGILHRKPGSVMNVSETEKRTIELLMKRNLVERTERKERRLVITEKGREILKLGSPIEEEITQLTPEMIRTGSWKRIRIKGYDVNLPSKELFPAKIHPYQRILEKMRNIFTEMGFVEIKGELVQSAFWNFDALFVPQDHPAREMQDTFYLAIKKPIAVKGELIRNVKHMHEHGGSLNSIGWGGKWKRELGEELLLRTHTTVVTINYLASHPDPPVKVFCIDRVYRRETIDPLHLPELDQLEGIVMDEGVSFANLLGLLSTFYKKMGFPSIRFRPGYFPYTEPSVEVEVYMKEKGWIELGGAGVFREEVTNPMGIKYPVLAWGLGIGRLAMISLGLKDIRDLYRPDIQWLKEKPYFI